MPKNRISIEKIRAMDLIRHIEVCPYKMVACLECGASMMLMENKTHSCIIQLKSELKAICSSMKDVYQKMREYEVENSKLSKKNEENEKHIKELNGKMENKKKAEEKKENELGQKIKSLEEENSSLSNKLEMDEKMIKQLLAKLQFTENEFTNMMMERVGSKKWLKILYLQNIHIYIKKKIF